MPPRILFAEPDDPRIAAAARRLQDAGIAVPVFPEPAGPSGSGTAPAPDPDHVALILRRRPGMKPALAERLACRPLYRAASMVACGAADALVAGAATPTRRVIEAAVMTIGLAPGVSVPSSFFLMRFPGGREMIFADCALNVAPDAGQLAAIAAASAASARALLGEARVALLSYATGTSGTGAPVARVAEAVRALSGQDAAAPGTPSTAFTGPVQADAALNPRIAALKGLEGGGDANVLIFPSLEAGNIAYKLARELAHAQAVGPVLQGFARPVCDLSRGATEDDIVAAATLTLRLAEGAAPRG